MRIQLEGADPRLPYFAWALEQSESTQGVANYLSTAKDVNADAVAEWIGRAVDSELDLLPRRGILQKHWPYAQWASEGRHWYERFIPTWRWFERRPRTSITWRNPSTAVPADYVESISPWNMDDLRRQLGADERGHRLALVEEAAYRLMLVAFLGALNSNPVAIRWLCVLMVRGGLNRQLTISHFLAVASGGTFGNTEMALPSPPELLEWAQASVTQFKVEPALRQMVSDYVARAQWRLNGPDLASS